MKPVFALFFLVVSFLGNGINAAHAADTPAAELPIREVTTFKDGNALVVRRGDAAVTQDGNVILTQLPSPLLGTFWPSTTSSARLVSVVAGKRQIPATRDAQSIADLLAANLNADVTIVDTLNNSRFDASILHVLGSADATTDSLVLLKTSDGQRALPIKRIADITFKNAPVLTQPSETTQPELTLHFDGNGKAVGKSAPVTLLYVQKGLRWIPEYKIDLSGSGTASAQFAATLVNDLADLDHVTANLVIGVPKFIADGQLDPLSLRETVTGVSNTLEGNLYGNNAYATQATVYREAADAPSGASSPEIEGGARTEDLFVFTVKNVTLRQSERVNLPIQTLPLTYRDVYTLDIAPTPPVDVYANLNSSQQSDIAQKLAMLHVIHVARLHNTTAVPLTTAPALLLAQGHVLGQTQMTYTPAGGTVDLEAGTSLDVPVSQSGHEIKRTANAQEWQGYQYARVDLTGEICITNDHPESITLEATREVAGFLDDGDNGAAVEQADPLSDASLTYARTGLYNNAGWWGGVNGIGRATWKLTVPPGKTVRLKYNWHYFWR